MKESRLFKIIYYILEKGRVSAPELAQQFEVSVRTIYRDVDVISSAGIPIYVTTGRNGGIQILDHYVLEKVLLSDKEKQDLLSALQSLSLIDGSFEKELMTKLSALFHVTSKQWFDVDFSRWGNKSQDNTKLELLKKAIIYHKAMEIVYVGSDCKKSTRKIHPLLLSYKSKEWYIKAFCTKKQDFRLFKMNRVIDCRLLEEDFIPMDFPDLQKEDAINLPKVILRFPKEMAYRVYDEFSYDELTVEESGDFLVTANMAVDSWLIGFLLSFGSYVEVIAPDYIQKILWKEAEKIYKKHKP